MCNHSYHLPLHQSLWQNEEKKQTLAWWHRRNRLWGGKSECFNVPYVWNPFLSCPDVKCHLTVLISPTPLTPSDESVSSKTSGSSERSVVWITLSACLDGSRPNHKSHVFPMFLPSSPQSKPQRAYPACTSKPSLPMCWNFNYTPINLALLFL